MRATVSVTVEGYHTSALHRRELRKIEVGKIRIDRRIALLIECDRDVAVETAVHNGGVQIREVHAVVRCDDLCHAVAESDAAQHAAADAHIRRSPIASRRFENKDRPCKFYIVEVSAICECRRVLEQYIPGINVIRTALDPSLFYRQSNAGDVDASEHRGIAVKLCDACRVRIDDGRAVSGPRFKEWRFEPRNL